MQHRDPRRIASGENRFDGGAPVGLQDRGGLLRKGLCRFKSGDPNANGKQDEIPLSITKGNVAYGFSPVFGINVPLRQSTAATDTLLPAWHVAFDRQVLPFMRSPWPFLYYLPNESAVENQYMTDINTCVDEMDLKFITGAESLANFDKYIEILRKMNIEEVLKARQVQWDRYRASSR